MRMTTQLDVCVNVYIEWMVMAADSKIAITEWVNLIYSSLWEEHSNGEKNNIK
jgi:hypothetical protein